MKRSHRNDASDLLDPASADDGDGEQAPAVGPSVERDPRPTPPPPRVAEAFPFRGRNLERKTRSSFIFWSLPPLIASSPLSERPEGCRRVFETIVLQKRPACVRQERTPFRKTRQMNEGPDNNYNQYIFFCTSYYDVRCDYDKERTFFCFVFFPMAVAGRKRPDMAELLLTRTLSLLNELGVICRRSGCQTLFNKSQEPREGDNKARVV